MSSQSAKSKLGAVFHHWAPSISCVYLTYYLGNGALSGVGSVIGEAWASVGVWAAEPVSFPRWAVLLGTIGVLAGSIFLGVRQYQRVKALEKNQEEMIRGLSEAFEQAALDLDKP